MIKQIEKMGDVFWVPIEGGSLVLGQVVEIEKDVLNSITCAFYNVQSSEAKTVSLLDERPISIQFVTKDLFNLGVWFRVGNLKVTIESENFPCRELMKSGWVGAKVVGSGIMVKFLSAFYGHRNWAEMHDSMYYEKLLLPGITRDKNA